MRTFLAFLLLQATHAWALPNEITAEYKLTSHGVTIGTVTENYVRSGDTYRISSVTRSEGPLKVFLDDQLTLESTGKVGAEGLRPLKFTQRRARDSKRDIEATFDWDRGVMVSRFRGETHEVALPAQTQDRLSFMYQFMNMEAGSSPMAVSMANGRKVEKYAYRMVDEARVATPAGDFETRHYARITSAKESNAEVWLAKERYNLPVRVVFDDPKGPRLEQTLVALQTR
ncbi:MAG TPA: DUF3108 domain-containing protein [Usitatibacter sp.]|nr:DUF3108 domain-containing protein [Usitatibacter sp.]